MGLLDWLGERCPAGLRERKRSLRKLLPRRSRVTKLLVRYCGSMEKVGEERCRRKKEKS